MHGNQLAEYCNASLLKLSNYSMPRYSSVRQERQETRTTLENNVYRKEQETFGN